MRLVRRQAEVYLTSILPKEVNVGVQERITTVISTKGQVILPKTIRDQRHWPAGTRLTVEDTPDGGIAQGNAGLSRNHNRCGLRLDAA